MNFEAITIRVAEAKDIKQIWDLLHTDVKTWSETEIIRNIQQLIVLTKQDKLLGVLFGELTPSKAEVIWVVIHPMYPENLLRELLFQSLKGTQIQHQDQKETLTLLDSIQQDIL
jgi:N-acetylglutamate synthase-like GNAT family acetyltransferase